MEIVVKEIKPSILNGWRRGFKVLQYETVMESKKLVGSRVFEDLEETERYKKKLEERRE